MSEPYTPTTEEVRDALEAWMWTSRPYRPEMTSTDPGEALDRFLDQVRREAKIEALRDATNELKDLDPKGDAVFWDGEYYVFVHGWLHDRADQLEQEGKNDD